MQDFKLGGAHLTKLRRAEGGSKIMVKRKKNKRKKNYLQNITQKTKDRATHIPLKTGGEFRCFGRVSSSDRHDWFLYQMNDTAFCVYLVHTHDLNVCVFMLLRRVHSE
jgi:hypothetical protein